MAGAAFQSESHNMTTTTRRAFLGATAAAAVVAAVPASAITATGDEAILAAWLRRVAAYVDYNALPYIGTNQWGHSERDEAEEERLWAIIDEAEAVIRSTIATTPQGLECQIWTALYHSTTEPWLDDLTHASDLDAVAARDIELDWNQRLMLAALKSVRAMTT